jgi:hypothetical protein
LTLTLTLVVLGLWWQALWAKRGLIAFSAFHQGSSPFFLLLFLCGKVPISSAFPQFGAAPLSVRRCTLRG